jgi:hypothetical protein
MTDEHETRLERMRELAESGDHEMAHIEADEILKVVLREQGYDDLVDAYESVGKWYA